MTLVCLVCLVLSGSSCRLVWARSLCYFRVVGLLVRLRARNDRCCLWCAGHGASRRDSLLVRLVVEWIYLWSRVSALVLAVLGLAVMGRFMGLGVGGLMGGMASLRVGVVGGSGLACVTIRGLVGGCGWVVVLMLLVMALLLRTTTGYLFLGLWASVCSGWLSRVVCRVTSVMIRGCVLLMPRVPTARMSLLTEILVALLLRSAVLMCG